MHRTDNIVASHVLSGLSTRGNVAFKWGWVGCLTLAVALALPARTQAQICCYNQDVKLLGAAHANAYQITLAGNRQFTDSINPFPNISPTDLAKFTVTYNSVSNTTTAEFSGGEISEGQTIHMGYTIDPGVTTAHGFGPPDVLAQGFTQDGTTVDQKVANCTLDIVLSGPSTGSLEYLVAYADIGFVGDPASDIQAWTAIQMHAGQNAMLALQNNGSQSAEINDYRYEIVPNITLAALTNTGTPPSTLNPIINAPINIDPSANSYNAVPEPSAIAFAGIGAMGVAAMLKSRLRRRK